MATNFKFNWWDGRWSLDSSMIIVSLKAYEYITYIYIYIFVVNFYYTIYVESILKCINIEI